MKKRLVIFALAVCLIFGCISTTSAEEADMSQIDLEKIAEVQSYIDQINTEYGLDLYVFDQDIIKASVESTKESIYNMAQESKAARDKEAEIDAKIAAGIPFKTDKVPRANSWGKVADNDDRVYMSITYTSASNPLRFTSITACSSSGRLGMTFQATMGFKKTFSNGNKTAVVKQTGLLRGNPGLGCAPVYNPNFTAVATYSF